MFGLRYTFTFTYISFHSCALQYICANPFKALISCVHPLYALLSEPQMSHLLPYYKSQLLPIHHSEGRAQNPDPRWRRFLTRVALQAWLGSMIFTFSMYPALHMFSVHSCCRVFNEAPMRFPCLIRASILDTV
jgi:hypothetical protein